MENPQKGPAKGKVCFEPFIGIAPYRYSDFFQKRRRKQDGEAQEWQNDPPHPIISVTSTGYVFDETDYLRVLIARFAEESILLPESLKTSVSDATS